MIDKAVMGGGLLSFQMVGENRGEMAIYHHLQIME
jgi:hypothetical protein